MKRGKRAWGFDRECMKDWDEVAGRESCNLAGMWDSAGSSRWTALTLREMRLNGGLVRNPRLLALGSQSGQISEYPAARLETIEG